MKVAHPAIRPCFFVSLLLSFCLLLTGVAGGESRLLVQRSFTDYDLQKYAAPRSGGAPSAEGASQGKPPDAGALPEPKSAGNSQYWCDTAARHRQDVEMSRQDLAKAEEALRLANDVILYQKEINETTLAAQNKAREAVEEARQRLRSAEEKLRTLEDEARAKSIPPGWLECRFE